MGTHKIWSGRWRFNNPIFEDYHGRSGHVKACRALNKEDAESEIKVRGYGALRCSSELFQFIEAHNVARVEPKKKKGIRR